jgi:hypothetical protein
MPMATNPQQVTLVPQPEQSMNDETTGEVINPQTGIDVSDVYPGSIEQMPITERFTGGATFQGDMGRLVR